MKKKQNSIGYRLQLEEDEGTSLRHWNIVPAKRLRLNQSFREIPLRHHYQANKGQVTSNNEILMRER